MIDWLKNVSWYIIDRTFTAFGCMLDYVYNHQERYDEAHRYGPPPGIYLFCIKAEDTRVLPLCQIALKPERCVKKRWIGTYIYCDMFQAGL